MTQPSNRSLGGIVAGLGTIGGVAVGFCWWTGDLFGDAVLWRFGISPQQLGDRTIHGVAASGLSVLLAELIWPLLVIAGMLAVLAWLASKVGRLRAPLGRLVRALGFHAPRGKRFTRRTIVLAIIASLMAAVVVPRVTSEMAARKFVRATRAQVQACETAASACSQYFLADGSVKGIQVAGDSQTIFVATQRGVVRLPLESIKSISTPDRD